MAVFQIPAKGSDLEKFHGLMIKAGGSYNSDDNPLAATYPAEITYVGADVRAGKEF